MREELLNGFPLILRDERILRVLDTVSCYPANQQKLFFLASCPPIIP
jgi:hypothetical protein